MPMLCVPIVPMTRFILFMGHIKEGVLTLDMSLVSDHGS
jgi:hypothetical protein